MHKHNLKKIIHIKILLIILLLLIHSTISFHHRHYISSISYRHIQYKHNQHRMSQWDHENGVWLDNRATASNAMDNISQLPDPLYILGYGSLIWKPSELLAQCLSYKCTALQWKRMFAQRSCDHRGTPQFPGLVLNLVKDSDLVLYGYKSKNSIDESSFKGLVYLIPKSQIQTIIDDLDYRERGGYERHLINVRLEADTLYHSKNDIISAIVYTGLKENPMFYLPDLSIQQKKETNITYDGGDVVAEVEEEEMIRTRLYHKVMISISDTIATAIGPSGTNVDYLCNLDCYLSNDRIDMKDPFLTELACRVRLQLGIWRSRILRNKAILLRNSIYTSMISTTSSSSTNAEISIDRSSIKMHSNHQIVRNILGWGSNEFLQLSNERLSLPTTVATTTPSSSSSGLLQSDNNNSSNSNDDWQQLIRNTHRYYAKNIQTTIPTMKQHSNNYKGTMNQRQHVINIQENVIESNSYYKNTLNYSSYYDTIDMNRNITTTTTTTKTYDDTKNSFNLNEIEHEYVVAGGSTSCYVYKECARIWGKLVPLILIHATTTATTATTTATTSKCDDDIIQYNHHHHQQQLTYEALNQSIVIGGVLGVAIGHDHMLLLIEAVVAVSTNTTNTNIGTMNNKLSREIVLGFGNNTYGQCNGICEPLDNIILEYNEKEDIYNFKLKDNKAIFNQKKVAKLATGLRHSVAISECGTLFAWGDNRYGQVGGYNTTTPTTTSCSDSTGSLNNDYVYEWKPEVGMLIDVACGSKYTMMVDDQGLVYYLGSIHGSVRAKSDDNTTSGGSSGTHLLLPTLMTSHLPVGIRWRKVVSGWSHFILRGTLPAALTTTTTTNNNNNNNNNNNSDTNRSEESHNKIVFAGGGKQNLAQYLTTDSLTTDTSTSTNNKTATTTTMNASSSSNKDFNVSILQPLPMNLAISEVWCGSEYTIVADEHNCLWGCGWNEHGNLGIGTSSCYSNNNSSNSCSNSCSSNNNSSNSCSNSCSSEIGETGASVGVVNTWKPVLRQQTNHSIKEYNYSNNNNNNNSNNNCNNNSNSNNVFRSINKNQSQVKLSYVWEGALSCGGAHVICLE